MRWFWIWIATMGLALGGLACGGSQDDRGTTADEVVEETGEGLGEGFEETGEAFEEAGEETGEGLEELGEELD